MGWNKLLFSEIDLVKALYYNTRKEWTQEYNVQIVLGKEKKSNSSASLWEIFKKILNHVKNIQE